MPADDPHDDRVDPPTVFDQLSPDLQDALLKTIAGAMLDAALKELADHDVALVRRPAPTDGTQRKAG